MPSAKRCHRCQRQAASKIKFIGIADKWRTIVSQLISLSCHDNTPTTIIMTRFRILSATSSFFRCRDENVYTTSTDDGTENLLIQFALLPTTESPSSSAEERIDTGAECLHHQLGQTSKQLLGSRIAIWKQETFAFWQSFANLASVARRRCFRKG